MSILIKGMEMPARCAVCALCDLRYGTKCKITKMSYYDSEGYPRGGYNGRPDWCPLVEVKEPHGDLIDRSMLDPDSEYEDGDFWAVSVAQIKLMPAAVEAEGREDGERNA